MATFWLNGQIVEQHKAHVSVLDHGVLYGDGVFEGIRYYYGMPFRLEAHLDRLYDSALALMLPLPYDKSVLTDAIMQVIDRDNTQDGYIRLVLTRGEGPLGLDPSNCISPNVFIVAQQLSMIAKEKVTEGCTSIISSTRRLAGDGLDPRIKSLNYLNHLMAKLEANYAGVDEAIMLNANGHVAEGSVDNIFCVKNDCLITPPVSDGALDGITRGVIIELAEKLGIPVSQRSITAYDLYTADEAFLTGTGAELIPLKSVDGRILKHVPGNTYITLLNAFRKLIIEECGKFDAQMGSICN